MKNLMNSVRLIGNVGAEPKVKELSSGRKMATLSLATTEKRKDAQGKLTDHTDWHNLVFWGRQADVVAGYVTRGAKLAIEGRLSHRDYTGADGQKRYITEVVVNEMAFLSGRRQKDNDGDSNELPF